MVCEGRGRLFKRKDGKYLLYLPVNLCGDSKFPFKTEDSIPIKISFRLGGKELLVEKWTGPETPESAE